MDLVHEMKINFKVLKQYSKQKKLFKIYIRFHSSVFFSTKKKLINDANSLINSVKVAYKLLKNNELMLKICRKKNLRYVQVCFETEILCEFFGIEIFPSKLRIH